MSAGDIDFFLIKFTFPYSVDAVVMGALQLSFSLLQFDRDEFQEPPFRVFDVKRLWHLTESASRSRRPDDCQGRQGERIARRANSCCLTAGAK